MNSARIIVTTVLCLTGLLAAAHADEAPRFSDPNDRIARTDLSGLPRLRFLTSLDFPPFNFADAQRKPAGFNIDIARALCDELQIEAKCEIQAMPWDELDATLDGLRGEAIIAGHKASAELRGKRDLSAPYFRFPARFVASRDTSIEAADMTIATKGRKVAVVAGSAHGAMLRAWFPEAVPVEVDDMAAAYSALSNGEAELIFGDGVTLAFWLASPASASCCHFVSGPFQSEYFLGIGMTIVMRKDSPRLSSAINAALKALEEKGVFGEIYMRYMPLDPFGEGAENAPSVPSEGQAQRPQQSG